MSKVIMIAGMHRSGTSLTAMWLKHCGLDLGENLMNGHFDNPKGHFEDLEILKIHEEDLKIKGLKTNGLVLRKNSFFFDDSIKQKALSFIHKKEEDNYKIWGWKEPRSTLYLTQWKELIPQLKIVAIFRPFHEVVNSLLERTKHSFLRTKKYPLFNRITHLSIFPVYLYLEKIRYLDAWIQYNNSILNFKKAFPDDMIITSLSSIIKKDVEILNGINQTFGLNLNPISIQGVYDQKLMHTNVSNSYLWCIGKEKDAIEVQNKLVSQSDF